MHYFLKIKDDKLVVERWWDNSYAETVIATRAGYDDFFIDAAADIGIRKEDLVIQGSSDLDFPEEFNLDAETLAILEAIRS